MTQAAILIVEDDLLGRELAQEMLRIAGYTVRLAEDGVGLLERVQAERPDLILMDLKLPHIDGLTLIRQLKADEQTRPTPIVVTTAFSQPELYAQALEAGAVAYLTKPLDCSLLLKTVATLLEH